MSSSVSGDSSWIESLRTAFVVIRFFYEVRFAFVVVMFNQDEWCFEAAGRDASEQHSSNCYGETHGSERECARLSNREV